MEDRTKLDRCWVVVVVLLRGSGFGSGERAKEGLVRGLEQAHDEQ